MMNTRRNQSKTKTKIKIGPHYQKKFQIYLVHFKYHALKSTKNNCSQGTQITSPTSEGKAFSMSSLPILKKRSHREQKKQFTQKNRLCGKVLISEETFSCGRSRYGYRKSPKKGERSGPTFRNDRCVTYDTMPRRRSSHDQKNGCGKKQNRKRCPSIENQFCYQLPFNSNRVNSNRCLHH